MKKILFLVLFCINFLAFAQDDVPNPGGSGGDGFGVPASPIDDYLFLLIPIAVMFIIYFAKKYKKQLN